MGLLSIKVLSTFIKKPVTRFCQQTSNIVEEAPVQKLVKGKLTYLFNPKTNHTIVRDSNQKMSIVMNGHYPESSFIQFGLKPNNIQAFGDANVVKVVNAKTMTISTRKEGHDFWPTLTQANSEQHQLRFRYT